MYYSSPFDFFFSAPTQRVVVLSDSEYKKWQQEKAEQEIAVLESKKNRYSTAVQEIDLKIEELQKEYALLPASNEPTS